MCRLKNQVYKPCGSSISRLTIYTIQGNNTESERVLNESIDYDVHSNIVVILNAAGIIHHRHEERPRPEAGMSKNMCAFEDRWHNLDWGNGHLG